MEPITSAFGALQTLMGGGAGPSASGPATQGGNAVTVGGLTVNRWNPWLVAAIAVLVLLCLYLLAKK